jgi:type IV pilus assembly protein PilC
VSDGFVHHWQGVILNTVIAVALLVIVLKLLRRSSTGRCWLDSIRLHIPIAGHVYYQMCVARFARTLGLLLGARVPVLDSLELAAASSGSAMLEQVVNTANLQVAGGERIADALSSTGFFGHSFCWLLATGEDRGEAELALNNLADSFEREALVRDRMMAILLTPVLVLGLGLIIVSIIVALYLPIFTLGDVISGT